MRAGGATFTGEAAFTLGWEGTALGRGHGATVRVTVPFARMSPRDRGQSVHPTLPRRDWEVLGGEGTGCSGS